MVISIAIGHLISEMVVPTTIRANGYLVPSSIEVKIEGGKVDTTYVYKIQLFRL